MEMLLQQTKGYCQHISNCKSCHHNPRALCQEDLLNSGVFHSERLEHPYRRNILKQDNQHTTYHVECTHGDHQNQDYQHVHIQKPQPVHQVSHIIIGS